MKNWQSKEDIQKLVKQLIEYPSITGSMDELAISEYIELRLQELPYFQTYPHMLNLHPTKDGRKLLTALVKQDDTKETVILLSHFDVVDIEDYGEWKNLAFRPEALTKAFKQNYEKMPKDVQKDLDSGDWLFGRGSMDMKAGLSLHMSLIESACYGEFDGNVLLLTVPDEEVNSVGMTEAVNVLLELAYTHQLEYRACVNSEPMFTRFPGDENYYIYSGSIGKVLPGFFCYGKETHVGEPFAGLNANYMVSELNKQLELNTDFCEVVDGEVTPPPTNLMQKDLKEGYSVQIPNTAVTLFNIMTMEQPLEHLNLELIKVAEKASSQVKQHVSNQAQKFAKWLNFTPQDVTIKVMTYEQLRYEAVKRFGKEEIERRESFILNNFNELGDRDLSKQLVFDLTALCKDLAPIIILFYSPPFYPAISSRYDHKINSVTKLISKYAQDQYGISLKHQRYFPGLSDLSFFGLQQTTASLYSMISNMPLYGKRYELPIDGLKALDVPVLNLGPLGRDAHKWTERLNTDYTFGPLREMLELTLHELFK